jgi:hypothetical protein
VPEGRVLADSIERMLRPLSLLPALMAAAAITWGVPTASAAAPQAEDGAPLEVTIDELAPAAIPERGRITIRGSVTNISDETWTAISLYPFVASDPLTTHAEIAEATVSDPAVPVGDRVLDEGPYDGLDELGPGETLGYTVRVRAQDLDADESGVYWFGVHALGLSSSSPPGDTTADGRARTFLPKLGGSGREVPTSIVVPLREGLEYDADGALTDPASWAASLAPDGDLGSVLGLGQAAGGRPLTWLVDPAVTAAVERLGAGNPPRELGATVDPAAPEAGRATSSSPRPTRRRPPVRRRPGSPTCPRPCRAGRS